MMRLADLRRNYAAKAATIISLFLIVETLLYLYADRPLELCIFGIEDSRKPLLDFFRSITDLGKAQWYLWPAGIAALFCGFISHGKDVPRRYRRLLAYIGVRCCFIFAAVALSGIVADIIKPLLGRARPFLLTHHEIYGLQPFAKGYNWHSMPSGHATTVFALACALSVFYPRLRPLWLPGAAILAASRVLVEAHYLSDVLAGAALGWAAVHILMKPGVRRLWRGIFPIDTAPGPL